MKKDFWRRILSGLATVSLLVNSLLPYSIAIAHAQESTDLVVQETTLSLETPLPTESPSVSPPPDSTPAITGDATPIPTPEVIPTPTLEITPTASPEATPSNLSPPITTPTPEPSPEIAPSATPIVSLNPSTESASISQEKNPLRIAGDLQKYSRKQVNNNYIEGEVIV
ncbi:hypothetical protein HY405_00005, partial [Candidatus Microgenomates bacterium]|nr:hypothetical protein [Candidatus Microgenomates bacterium]